MKFSFNIQASTDKNSHSEKLVIVAFDNESGEHIALKLLAYLMFIERHPHIDEDAGWHFTPDLIARDEGGDITLWVDCGSVSVKKVDTIATKVRSSIDFYIFRSTEREMDNFYRIIKDKVKHIQNVKCISFDDEFVRGIGACLDRTNNLEAYVTDEMITLTITNSFGKHEAYSTVHKITPVSA
ncbi:MAG: YaeQ family protein [Cyanobacteria bacterium SZAS LIN-2]|nr:YaeQ family protein [Cyanobacteria bacterium SZAS LIN-3]MBS1997940.1 YaeQ family protein [Cyanobacteria bacterium SZAS LIN-2]MBS2007037.1 YaeQ family protein [Cyanobacteria bacterium SZAS TMP-1]